MFRRITFKAWRNVAANMAKREELGHEVYDKLNLNNENTGYEEVETERIEYVEYSTDEEQETAVV